MRPKRRPLVETPPARYSHIQQGRIQDFPKGRVETGDNHTKWGGGGCCPLQARHEKRGGGGGGGGGGGLLSGASGPIQKAGRGCFTCLAEEGAVPYNERGGSQRKNPGHDLGQDHAQGQDGKIIAAKFLVS